MTNIAIGILIGAGGALLAALVIYVTKKLFDSGGPRLSATLIAVPAKIPSQLIMQGLSGLSEGTGLSPAQIRVLNSVLFDLDHLDGLLLFSITNRGREPAEEVFLRVPHAQFFRIGDQTEVGRTVSDSTIVLGTISQGHKQTVTVWTRFDSTKYGWSWMKDVTLAHRKGIGAISGRQVIRNSIAAKISLLNSNHVGITAIAFVIAFWFLVFVFVLAVIGYRTAIGTGAAINAPPTEKGK